MMMSNPVQGYYRRKETPAAETIVSFLRLMALGMVLACVFAPAGFTQEEMEFEEREALQELEGLRQEAEELFTPEREQFLAKELPATIALLEKYRNAAESASAGMESKWKLYEYQRDLAFMADDLLENKKYRSDRFPKLKRYYQLDHRARELADAYNESTKPEGRDQLESELRTVLEEAFALAQSDRESEAKEVEAELARIWSLLEKRRQHKEAIIDRRMSQLIYGDDPLDW